MTPAQRQFDVDLVNAMRNMAKWIAPRSRKVSSTLEVAADRLETLTFGMPIDPPPRPDTQIQPASTPDQAAAGNR